MTEFKPKERRGIMGACDYSIVSMQNIKKGLMDVGSPNHELTWAIGGIVVMLTSNLIRICDEVFRKLENGENPNARQDLLEIKGRFDQFFDQMVNHE